MSQNTTTQTCERGANKPHLSHHDYYLSLVLEGLSFKPTFEHPHPPLKVQVALECWERNIATCEALADAREGEDLDPEEILVKYQGHPYHLPSQRKAITRQIRKEIEAHWKGKPKEGAQ